MVDIAKLSIQVDSSQVAAVTKQLDKMGVSGVKVEKQSKNTGQALGGMGRRAGQAGIQIQQLVGQVQGGVNPMVALSQQAADLGFVLGFPLLGAVAGISAALAGPLVTALFNVSDAAEDAEKSLEGIIESLDSTKRAALEGTFALIAKELEELDKKQAKIEAKDVSRIRSITGRQRAKIDRVKKLAEVEKRRAQLLEAQSEVESQLNKKAIEEAEDRIEKERDLSQILADTRIRGRKRALMSIERLNAKELSAEDRLRENLFASKTAIANAYGQDVISHQEALDMKMQAEQRYRESVKKLEDQEKAAKVQQNIETLGTFSEIAGNIAKVAAAGGKKQFETYKAFASAQALISTYLAITKALAEGGPIAGPILAGTIGALGMVQVAQIQAQEYQGSYLGGGFTGHGPRTGGIDGMGGFPAILHPNETVIDHTKQSGGMSANITVNNNAGGAVASVRQLDDANFIIDVVSADIARGGRTGRTMQTAYGARRARR